MRRSTIALLSLIAAVGCGTATTNNSQEAADSQTTHYAPGTRRMERNVINTNEPLTAQQQRRQLIDGYWDNFDFNADTAVIAYDTLDIFYAMADYVQLIEPERADSLMEALMHRAESSRPVLDYFANICRMVLHDPNSPLRNDEYYIPVLKVLSVSPLMDEYDRLAPAYDLELALKNRIGKEANDITYTLANGRRGRLHDIEADYTLLMFNNPDCAMCSQLISDIESSPMLNEYLENGRLSIVAIYPDADIEAWRNYQSSMPVGWISGYDAGQIISRDRLYDLKAIPSLYLLDSDKRVMIKDGSDVVLVEHVIATAEAQHE